MGSPCSMPKIIQPSVLQQFFATLIERICVCPYTLEPVEFAKVGSVLDKDHEIASRIAVSIYSASTSSGGTDGNITPIAFLL